MAFIVNKVSQFMHLPNDVHWTVIKRILRYITHDYELVFRPSSMNLTGFSDADWASSLEDHKSTLGFCFYLGDNLVGWSLKKQTVISRSTSEVEYR